jgi:hypothetical protein
MSIKHDNLFHLYSGTKDVIGYSGSFKNGMSVAIENNSIKNILQDKKNIS